MSHIILNILNVRECHHTDLYAYAAGQLHVHGVALYTNCARAQCPAADMIHETMFEEPAHSFFTAVSVVRTEQIFNCNFEGESMMLPAHVLFVQFLILFVMLS